MDIQSLLKQSREFATELSEIKAKNQPTGFSWYGYDILSNLFSIERLLSEKNRNIFAHVKSMPLADIGAADGDLSFFLEERGFDIDIIDWPATNWNSLRGAYRLKELLQSRVDIHEVNLNEYFKLPRSQYGLVIFLGILYHLQNPYYILNQLSHVASYCLLSTRIAQVTADRKLRLSGASVAYLLDTNECNNDSTNYWIFSQPGLEKLLKRTGWQILDYITVGNTEDSDPSSPDRDERAYMLIKSSYN